MNRNDGAKIKACGVAVQYFHAHGRVEYAHRLKLRAGRMVLRRYMRELSASESGKNAACYLDILQALQNVRPGKVYESSETFIRDVADVCISLVRIEEEQIGRTENIKLFEANLFCNFLFEQLTAPDHDEQLSFDFSQ